MQLLRWVLLLLPCHVAYLWTQRLRLDRSFDEYRPRVSIDYGSKFIGIATSNSRETVPLATIPNEKNQVALAMSVLDIAVQQGAREIIVGVPFYRGTEVIYSVTEKDVPTLAYGSNSRLCCAFGKLLTTAVLKYSPHMRLFLFDEQYSTKAAAIRLRNAPDWVTLDAMAAACILECYQNDNGEGAVSVEPFKRWPPPKIFTNFDRLQEYYRENTGEFALKYCMG